MLNTRPRRQSLIEGNGSKMKRLNALYPKMVIPQHTLEKERECRRKKNEAEALQKTIKNSPVSSTNKCQLSVRGLKCYRRNLNIETSKSKSRQSSRSNYADVKQIFLSVNFKTPKYSARNLLIVDSYHQNKENLSSVYNFRSNKTINKIVNEEYNKRNNNNNKQFLLKSQKSTSGYLSVKSAFYL